MEFGYALSSEEHRPLDLVDNAVRAEDAGFAFVSISDHFHPWTDSQGNAPFVWSVIGGIAARTSRIRVGTGVTCPIIRIHPAIIAQAAATAAVMLPGRFMLGVGTGENLNEHVLGDKWPIVSERQEMLAEAVEVIRMLWDGEQHTHHGDFYDVENARLYTVPDTAPPLIVAASGPESAELAADIGDGLWTVGPEAEVVKAFTAAGGNGPRIGQLTFCYAASADDALATVREAWPIVGLKGPLNQELPIPAHFEQAAEMVTDDDIREALPLGPDAAPVLEKIAEFEQAGYDHVYLHQIGPDQTGFFEFWERELRPQLA
jgi:G6PDH family F420-dependent oxidoreductase